MKKAHLIPILAVIASGAVNYLLIDFWLADLYAATAGVSQWTAYWSLVTLLILYSAWRAIMILCDRDDPITAIERWVNDKFRK